MAWIVLKTKPMGPPMGDFPVPGPENQQVAGGACSFQGRERVWGGPPNWVDTGRNGQICTKPTQNGLGGRMGGHPAAWALGVLQPGLHTPATQFDQRWARCRLSVTHFHPVLGPFGPSNQRALSWVRQPELHFWFTLPERLRWTPATLSQTAPCVAKGR